MARNLKDVGKNLQKIVLRLESNQNLLKFLYYTGVDPLSQLDLTKEQIKEEIFEKLIKVVPNVSSKETAKSILSIRVLDGKKNSNGEFVNLEIKIDLFVPILQWKVNNENLRPFCIMGEIETSLDGRTVDGLGRMENYGFELSYLTDDMSCYTMSYGITIYD